MNEDRSSRYHRLKRQAGILSTAWSLVLLAGLLWSGASVAMRNLAGESAFAIVFYVGLLLLFNEFGSLPLSFTAASCSSARCDLSIGAARRGGSSTR